MVSCRIAYLHVTFREESDKGDLSAGLLPVKQMPGRLAKQSSCLLSEVSTDMQYAQTITARQTKAPLCAFIQ